MRSVDIEVRYIGDMIDVECCADTGLSVNIGEYILMETHRINGRYHVTKHVCTRNQLTNIIAAKLDALKYDN